MDMPQLPWFKVLFLVAKHSSEDLYSMAGTCKLFQEMLNDPEVWRTVSIQKYPWHDDWYRSREAKFFEFLQKCKTHNNPEITYRQAFHDFFILNDYEAVNNFRVAAMAGHMESCYLVGLLGMLNPSEGNEDAMEFLYNLNKIKKIDMRACRELIFDRLVLLYKNFSLVNMAMLKMFTADESYFQECVHCEGNREWYLAWRCWGGHSYNAQSWNCYAPCKWMRELYCFQRYLTLHSKWLYYGSIV